MGSDIEAVLRTQLEAAFDRPAQIGILPKLGRGRTGMPAQVFNGESQGGEMTPHDGGIGLSGSHLPPPGAETPRRFHLREMGHEVAVAGGRTPLPRRRRPQIAGKDADAVAQDVVVQNRGGLVENQKIDVVVVEPPDELGRELRTVPESAFFRRFFIDVNRDVQIAVRLRLSPRMGAEQVGLENLPSGFEQVGDALVQAFAGIHDSSRRRSESAGDFRFPARVRSSLRAG